MRSAKNEQLQKFTISSKLLVKELAGIVWPRLQALASHKTPLSTAVSMPQRHEIVLRGKQTARWATSAIFTWRAYNGDSCLTSEKSCTHRAYGTTDPREHPEAISGARRWLHWNTAGVRENSYEFQSMNRSSKFC